MKPVYFVAFNLLNNIHGTHSMYNTVIEDAENKYEALGQALDEVNVGPSIFVADYSVREFDPVEISTSNIERQIEIAEESFFTLLAISEMTIMQNVHKLLLDTNEGLAGAGEARNKIPAIKLLREHTKPFLGLKSCKEIVELWVSEIRDNMPKSSLFKIARIQMGYKI